jgi:hypothetical protein
MKSWDGTPLEGAAAPPPPRRPDRAAELSDTILFDYLTGNHDRWGGNFTNVRTLGRDGPLVLIDNANGFAPRPFTSAHDEAKLHYVQRFRRRTVTAIEGLNIRRFQTALNADPLAPLLTANQLQALEKRRARLLSHVKRMQQEFGERAFPW